MGSGGGEVHDGHSERVRAGRSRRSGAYAIVAGRWGSSRGPEWEHFARGVRSRAQDGSGEGKTRSAGGRTGERASVSFLQSSAVAAREGRSRAWRGRREERANGGRDS